MPNDLERYPLRSLRSEEESLIHAMLLRASADDRLAYSLHASQVSDMRDGGMGSICFHPFGRLMGVELITAESADEDGVLVSIVLNLDKGGELFELDLWKVDFSPLIRFPNPADLIYR